MVRKEPSFSRPEHPRAKADIGNPTSVRKAKPERCKHCKKALGERERAIHSACVDGWYAANREKIAKRAAAKNAKAERENFKVRKEAIKTIADLIAEAQAAFNAFVRARDHDKGCISCGKPFPPQKPGGSFDAGHFISRGHATHLRFDEDNCFGQCKGCNRPGGATRAQVTAGVLARIGPERLAAVEGNYEVHKWTREELTAIKAEYRAKRRALEKQSA